jgi:hypothetical protein
MEVTIVGSAFFIAGTVLIVGGALAERLNRLGDTTLRPAPLSSAPGPFSASPAATPTPASYARESWSDVESKARELGYRVSYNSTGRLVIEKRSGRIEVFQSPEEGWRYLNP